MKQFLTPSHNEKSLLRLLNLLLISWGLTLWLMVTPAYATGVYDLPALSAGDATWIVDQADVISRVNEGQVSNALKDLAQQTGNEVRLVAIRRLDYEETIDSFADKLFKPGFRHQKHKPIKQY